MLNIMDPSTQDLQGKCHKLLWIGIVRKYLNLTFDCAVICAETPIMTSDSLYTSVGVYIVEWRGAEQIRLRSQIFSTQIISLNFESSSIIINYTKIWILIRDIELN